MESIFISGLLLTAIMVIVGIASCFYGKKLFKVLLVVIGFFIGAYITAHYGASLIKDSTVLIVSAIVGGIIIGLVILFFYYVGVFFSGVTVVILFSSYFKLNYHNIDHLIIILILCAIGGVLALIFHNIILTIATAIIGGWSITNGAGYLIYYLKDNTKSLDSYLNYLKTDTKIFYIVLLFTLILTILGIIYQFKLSHED